MSAPPFALHYSAESLAVLSELEGSKSDAKKHKKVLKALKLLAEVGPTYPGLNSHKYQSVTGPNGADLWEIYVENNTPGAWRIWWSYGPDEDAITIVTIGPHPD